VYRFSRSIYRELAPYVQSGGNGAGSTAEAKHHLLEASEATMRRMAADRKYFARPARTLFCDVRSHFALEEQRHVYRVINTYVNLALEHLERMPDFLSVDGQPRECRASTRKGTPCRREPLPGRDYCPSHKHLEESDQLEGERFEERDFIEAFDPARAKATPPEHALA
jgi:hypothetical protein